MKLEENLSWKDPNFIFFTCWQLKISRNHKKNVIEMVNWVRVAILFLTPCTLFWHAWQLWVCLNIEALALIGFKNVGKIWVWSQSMPGAPLGKIFGDFFLPTSFVISHFGSLKDVLNQCNLRAFYWVCWSLVQGILELNGIDYWVLLISVTKYILF